MDIKLWPVHKNIFLNRMSMQVNKYIQLLFVFSLQILNQLKQMKSLWKGKSPSSVIRSIQILTKQRCTIVSSHHTVRIYHRNNVRDEIFTILFRRGFLAAYVLHKSLAYERTVRLPRMYPPSDHNNFLIIILIILIHHLQHWHHQPT